MHGIMKAISHIYRSSNLVRGERLSDSGLNGCQHPYILHICRQPGLTQEQLAQRVCVNRSNVTRQLNRLEQQGFVLRRADVQDKRVLRVYPTSKAQALFPKLQAHLRAWREYLLEPFTPEQQEQLCAMLDVMMQRAVAAAQKIDGNAPPKSEEETAH